MIKYNGKVARNYERKGKKFKRKTRERERERERERDQLVIEA